MYTYSRPVRFTNTQSGYLLNAGTLVSNITIDGVNGDCHVNLRDNGLTGPILWSGEADNASSASSTSFVPPMKLFKKTYVEIVGSSESSVTINVIEP